MLSWFQTDPSFGASDGQIFAEDSFLFTTVNDVNGNHGAWTACSWGSFKRPSVFWEEFLELPRSSLLPPKAIEMAGKNVSKISNWSERYHLDPSCWSVINPNSSSPIDYPSIFASIFLDGRCSCISLRWLGNPTHPRSTWRKSLVLLCRRFRLSFFGNPFISSWAAW